jgi:hypothetical protein
MLNDLRLAAEFVFEELPCRRIKINGRTGLRR